MIPEKYDQQDGAPNPRPDSGEAVSDQGGARAATVGERSTEASVAGQGLGQMKGEETERRTGESDQPEEK